jgi:hypothetical protein
MSIYAIFIIIIINIDGGMAPCYNPECLTLSGRVNTLIQRATDQVYPPQSL